MDKKLMLFIGSALLAFLFSSCGTASAQPSQPAATLANVLPAAPTELPTATPLPIINAVPTEIPMELPTSPARSDNDKCDNQFYPVVNGAQWTYQNAAGQFTHTIATSSDNTFSVAVKSTDNAFDIQGLCLDGDINLLDVPGISLSHTGENGGSTMTTTQNEGVTLPGDIYVGDDWSQTIGVEVSAGDLKMNYVIEATYVAADYESVTVPAGTFMALKVTQSSTMEGSDPILQTLWYVENIGLVKSVLELDKPVVSELVSFNIP